MAKIVIEPGQKYRGAGPGDAVDVPENIAASLVTRGVAKYKKDEAGGEPAHPSDQSAEQVPEDEPAKRGRGRKEK